MKILVLGNQKRYEKYMPDMALTKNSEIIYCACGTAEEEIVERGKEADVIFADAMGYVTRFIIEHLPNLKLIHSEGAGFDKIDTKAAAERGIYVCNNKGANAKAVAEQAILLMLGLLRFAVAGDREVRAGRQIQMKEEKMVSGIHDLGDATVGLIGFGDIGKATAHLLQAFGTKVYYYTKHRKDVETEAFYGVTYLPLEEMLPLCDIVSLHMAVTEETTNMVNSTFFEKMKEGAYLINTARGELVNGQDLYDAIVNHKIGGAGLDTLYPEPVKLDNVLLNLPEEEKDKVFFAPHLGGVTVESFGRMHTHMWQNAERIAKGERPDCIVNNI